MQPGAADQAHLDDGAPPAGRRQRVWPRQQGRQQRSPDGGIHRPTRTRYGLGLSRFRLPGIENRFFFAIFGHMTGNRFLSQIESQ